MAQEAPVRARDALVVRASQAGVCPVLRHLAIIPDGNRRWAAARGIPVWEGVRTGVQTAEKLFEAVRRRQIPWCTFWASSYDNLVARPTVERRILNDLFARWFGNLVSHPTIHGERVRVRALGEWRDLLAAPAVAAIERIVAATQAYDGAALTFLVGYDGDRELASAVNAFAAAAPTRKLMHAAELKPFAWTKELPEVDLLVRTGSWTDPHRSANMLPFQTSNVQEAYPHIYWPDFSEGELDTVLTDFASRGRRRGR